MSIKEFCALLIVCMIWGLHFVVIKLIVNGVSEPLFYSAMRISIVALILMPKLKWHTGQMRPLLIASLAYGGLNYAFMFPALRLTTASAAAITIELFVPFSIILSIFIFKDRIGLIRGGGILLALTGVGIIALAGPQEAAGPYFWLGVLMIAGAAMSEAVGANCIKLISGINPLQLLAWFSLVGSFVLWPLSFILEDNQFEAFSEANRANFLLGLIYSALLVSILAHGLYYWLLQRLPIYVVATSGLLTTVFGMSGAIILLKEPFTGSLFTGAALTLIGVGLILWRNNRASPTSAHNISP